MRRKILPFILGTALSVAAVAPAAAVPPTNVQRGGAAGLVDAVVQVAAGVDDIEIANNSLNNLLRNADIDVLNNVLNNSLNDLEIRILEGGITDNNIVVSVLSGGVVIGDFEVTPSQ